MRIPDDLHDDDRDSRQRLIETLRCSRKTRRLSFARIGRLLGISMPATAAIEARTTWQARTIMQYARTIGWAIQWHPVDLVVPDDDDVMAAVLAAGDTSTPDRADRVHWRRVCYDLVRVRRATVTAVAMGELLGVTQNAVHHWEANFDGSSVIAAQRHARALGGRLDWDLVACDSPLVPLVPAPRAA